VGDFGVGRILHRAAQFGHRADIEIAVASLANLDFKFIWFSNRYVNGLAGRRLGARIARSRILAAAGNHIDNNDNQFNFMANIVSISQIIISIAIIGLVLMQQRGGAGLGSAFGQSGGAYSTQRGIQKKIFRATLVLAIIFIGLAIYNLFQK